MDELDLGPRRVGDGSLGKFAHPGAIVVGEGVTGPIRGGEGDGVEITGIGKSAARAIVIAAYEDLSEDTDAIDDFVGACAVADDVTEVGYSVVSGSRCEAGFKGIEISVNIAKNQ